MLAALIATSSAVLTNRTWVFWVDTDAVNLFALFAICLIFSLSVPSRPFRTQLAMAALAGTSVAMFIGLYGKTGFYVVYSAVFILCLFGSGFQARRVALLTAVFSASSSRW